MRRRLKRKRKLVPWVDPIVAEVHAVREQIWKEAGGTREGLHAYHRRLQDEARRAGVVVISPTREQAARVEEALRRYDSLHRKEAEPKPGADPAPAA